MPGLVGHDFGDAIRFAANFVEEDCDYPEKAGVNLNIFWAFAEGFLKKTAASLTKNRSGYAGAQLLCAYLRACNALPRGLHRRR